MLISFSFVYVLDHKCLLLRQKQLLLVRAQLIILKCGRVAASQQSLPRSSRNSNLGHALITVVESYHFAKTIAGGEGTTYYP